MRPARIANFARMKSAAAYSAKPQIADCEPPDAKFACPPPADREAADRQSTNCNGGEGESAASKGTDGDGAESEGSATSAGVLGGSPDGAFLPVFVHHIMHSGKRSAAHWWISDCAASEPERSRKRKKGANRSDIHRIEHGGECENGADEQG